VFRVLGFLRVKSMGFRGIDCADDFELRVNSLGIRVQGLGPRV